MNIAPDSELYDLPELISHSFIVKIWLEEAPSETEKILWRGRITHIGSGEHRYIETLDGITDFIQVYLNLMGNSMGET